MGEPSVGRGVPVMHDVARLAGVSHQTVSRVINGSPRIRAETRERVEQAIRQLGYRPNVTARALVRGRSGQIGVISVDGTQYGPASIQRSIEVAVREAGLSASTVSLTEPSRDRLDDSVEQLRRQGVEGIVLVAGQDDAVEVVRGRTSGLPIVLVEGDLSRTRMSVGVDQVAGSRTAVRHLIDLGHRRIAHLAGPADWVEARARVQGWRAELEAAGLRPAEPRFGAWTAEFGHRAGQAVAEDETVTAVFAANDQIAIGLLLALHEAGRRVPEDVSVVGFDDQPEAAFLIPPLTTVRQDFALVGVRAVQMITAAIDVAGADDAAQPATPDLVEPQLIIRRSTGPAPT